MRGWSSRRRRLAELTRAAQIRRKLDALDEIARDFWDVNLGKYLGEEVTMGFDDSPEWGDEPDALHEPQGRSP